MNENTKLIFISVVIWTTARAVSGSISIKLDGILIYLPRTNFERKIIQNGESRTQYAIQLPPRILSKIRTREKKKKKKEYIELDVFVHTTLTHIHTEHSSQPTFPSTFGFAYTYCKDMWRKYSLSRENPFFYVETKSQKATMLLMPPNLSLIRLMYFTSHNEMQSRNTDSHFISLFVCS